MFFKKKINKNAVQATLESYTLEGVALAPFIDNYQIAEGVLELSLSLPSTMDAHRIHQELGQRLLEHGIQEMNMTVTHTQPKIKPPVAHTPQKMPAQDTLMAHPRIRHIIAIASGKGGVGKSTTAVNVALALKALGHQVGMLDADIYGPSLPDMLGVAGVKPIVENGQFVPIEAYGMPIMSIGSLLDSDETPIAWRGIKAVGALMQMYHDTAFPHLDYLVIDMPPGTGDIALSLAQKIPITGALIVTTPQHIALLDVKKGIELFNKTHVKVLGIVENMAMHICSNCGHHEAIFGEEGARVMAERYGVALLGQLPLAAKIGRQMDKGLPSVVAEDEFAKYYLDIAKAIDKNIDKFAKARDETRIF